MLKIYIINTNIICGIYYIPYNIYYIIYNKLYILNNI